jgi:hypothetical protein
MIGLLFLWAAAAVPQSGPASQAPGAQGFRPSAAASAHATARIMVITGVKFGPDYSDVPSSGLRRSARLTDYDGQVRSAELLEFQ